MRKPRSRSRVMRLLENGTRQDCLEVTSDCLELDYRRTGRFAELTFLANGTNGHV